MQYLRAKATYFYYTADIVKKGKTELLGTWVLLRGFVGS